MKKIFFYICFTIFFASLFVACKKDNGPDPNQPVITLSTDNVTGLTEYNDTIIVAIKSPRKIKSLVITKGVNLQPDKTFGTNGEINVTDAVGKTEYSYQFIYTFQSAEVDKLVGINFRVTDEDGRATEADLTINTTVSGKEILQKYKWTLKSKFWVTANADDTKPFNKDDVYTFNADSVMTLDYGPLTEGLEVFNVYDKWYLSPDEKILTMEHYNLFDPSSRTVEVYTVEALTKDQLVVSIPFDLTWLGLSDHEVFRYTMAPGPK
jgi:hypothetical protein